METRTPQQKMPSCAGNAGWAFDLLLLFCFTLLLNSIGLGRLEFLRHTEADRTLISWEMLESGDYLVPHLVGGEILTKPPLYYWLSATTMKLLGSTAEWAARTPSVCAALFFVLLQYFFVRRITRSRRLSLLAAFFLSTSFSFFTLAVVAELDMFYGALSACALYAAYFSLAERSFSWTLSSYVLLAAAFFAKGPPVVFFFASVQPVCYLCLRRIAVERKQPDTLPSWPQYLRWNATGVLMFFGLLLLWLIPLAHRVGWHTLMQVARVEYIERSLFSARIPHSRFFYLFDYLGGLAPWSVLLLAAVGCFIFEKGKSRLRGSLACSPESTEADCMPSSTDKDNTCVMHQPVNLEFLLFNIIAVVLPLVMLSLSEAKAGRYSFPVQVFGVNLCSFAAFYLRRTKTEKLLHRLVSFFALLVAIGALPVAFKLELVGVSRPAFICSGIVLSFAALALVLAGLRRSVRRTFVAFALIMLALRYAQTQVYAPHRNAVRSVKMIAREINELVSPNVPVYNIELFERWVSYYLKRMGRKSIRLTPKNCASVQGEDGRTFLLLNVDEELWRLDLLRGAGVSWRVLKQFLRHKDSFLLVEAEATGLCVLKPERIFPTYPTKPFSFSAVQ